MATDSDSDSDPTSNPDLDPKAQRARMATAYHEAGHAVAATALGRPVKNVTISPAQLARGGVRLGACQMEKGRSKASRDPLEDEVVILFAGMVAEARFTGRYAPRGAAQDVYYIRRLLQNRGGNERQLERLEARLLDKTEHVLSDPILSKAIDLIAAELVEKESIRGRAVRHFFQQAEHAVRSGG